LSKTAPEGHTQHTTAAGRGLFNAAGKLRFTFVTGSTFTGLYAADGSLNAVETTEDDTTKGLYHPCGAIRTVYASSSKGTYAKNGALLISTDYNTTSRRLKAYGDSHAEYAHRATATTIDHQTESPYAWALALTEACYSDVLHDVADTFGRNFTGDNFGDAGDTAANCATNPRLSNFIAASGRISYVSLGTNDIAAGNSAATIQTNLTTIYTAILADHVDNRVILSTIPPNDLWVTPDQYTDPRYAVRAAVNAWIKALKVPKLYIADVNQYVEDFTSRGGQGGLWKAGYQVSGADSHYSSEGSYEAAKAIVPILNMLTVDVTPFDHTTAGNLLTNWQLSGTSGTRNPTTAGLITGPDGGTNQIADSWRVSRSSGTNTAAVETSKETDGAYAKQVLTFKPGGSSAFEFYVFESYIGGTNLIARDGSLSDGQLVVFKARLEVSDWDAQWGGYDLLLGAYSSADALLFQSQGLKYLDRTNRNYPKDAVDVYVSTVPFALTTAMVKFRIQLNTYSKMNTATTNGIIKISRPYFGVY
jgi:hypothetical protein